MTQDIEAIKAACAIRAKKTGLQESLVFTSLARLSHHLGCLNATSRLTKASTGALQLPTSMVSKMALGFAKDANQNDVLCILVGPYMWDFFKNLPLTAAVTNKLSRGITLYFRSPIIGEFKVRDLSLFLPIYSDKLWDAIHDKKVNFITLGKVVPSLDNPNSYQVEALHPLPAPLHTEIKAGKARSSIF